MSAEQSTVDPAFRSASPATIDVAHLPASAFDEAAPMWWGNLLFILIETTTVALGVAAYFYARMSFGDWPPPQVNVHPPLFHPVPDLAAASVNTLLIVGACALVRWMDGCARRLERAKVLRGLLVLLIVAAVAIVLRFFEFHATHFGWNDNTYGSLVWMLLGLHLLYLAAAAGEAVVMGLYILTHELDEKHALDVTLLGGYWYWTAGTWLVLYLVIYWSPRWL